MQDGHVKITKSVPHRTGWTQQDVDDAKEVLEVIPDAIKVNRSKMGLLAIRADGKDQWCQGIPDRYFPSLRELEYADIDDILNRRQGCLISDQELREAVYKFYESLETNEDYKDFKKLLDWATSELISKEEYDESMANIVCRIRQG